MSATLILTLISAISGSLPGYSVRTALFPPGALNLINASVAAGVALFNALKGGGSVTSEVQSALKALQAEYTAVQQNTSADPAIVGAITEIRTQWMTLSVASRTRLPWIRRRFLYRQRCLKMSLRGLPPGSPLHMVLDTQRQPAPFSLPVKP